MINQFQNIYLSKFSYLNLLILFFSFNCFSQPISQQWLKQYGGTLNIDDYGYALTIDKLGNVYVTGSVSNSMFGSDFGTVKYDANGF